MRIYGNKNKTPSKPKANQIEIATQKKTTSTKTDKEPLGGLIPLHSTNYSIIQWCMTLTDMRLTENMGLTEKSATTEVFM